MATAAIPRRPRFFLARDGEGRSLGFLEYVPGEYEWRPVDARGWLFVESNYFAGRSPGVDCCLRQA